MQRHAIRLLGLGAAQQLCFVGLLLTGDLRTAVPQFLLLYLTAFLPYLLAIKASGAAARAGTPAPLSLIVAFALLFRITLFFSDPSLSDDIYRYVWDGTLLNNGFNPYGYAPSATELTPLRGPFYEQINNRDVGTPYGPLALWTFAAFEKLHHSVQSLKIPFLLSDVLIMPVLLRMLQVLQLPRHNLIVYAWNPLVVVEVAASGHTDPLAVLLVLVGLYWLMSGRPWCASAAITLAVAAKYFAMAFLPLVWKKMKKGEWVVFPIGIVLLFAPFAASLEYHALSIITVAADWRFNDSLFALIHAATGSLPLAKTLVLALFITLLIIVCRKDWPLPRAVMIIVGGMLLLTTTFEPWYLIWMVPFLCLYPNRAWLLLTALIALSYHVLIRYQADGAWEQAWWVRPAIFVPFFALLVADWLRNTRRRRWT